MSCLERRGDLRRQYLTFWPQIYPGSRLAVRMNHKKTRTDNCHESKDPVQAAKVDYIKTWLLTVTPRHEVSRLALSDLPARGC